MERMILETLMAAAGSVAFAMFFGIRSKKLIFSALGGALAWATYLTVRQFLGVEAAAYFCAAAAGTLYAEALARILKTPVTVFLITSEIPLVPGGALYYSMTGLMSGDQARFIERGLYAMSAAGAMALGMFAATMLYRILGEIARVLISLRKS